MIWYGNRYCDLHDDLTLDALLDTTLTIYPGVGLALFTTNLCSLVAGLPSNSNNKMNYLPT